WPCLSLGLQRSVPLCLRKWGKDSHRGHEGHKGNIKVVRTRAVSHFTLSVENFLTQKPKIRDKPQISQITEPKGLGSSRRKNSSGTKSRWQRPCTLLL